MSSGRVCDIMLRLAAFEPQLGEAVMQQHSVGHMHIQFSGHIYRIDSNTTLRQDFVIKTTSAQNNLSYTAFFSFHFEQRQLRVFRLTGGVSERSRGC